MDRRVVSIISWLFLSLLLFPASGLAAKWSLTDSLKIVRNWHQATRLDDGQVLVVGGGSNLTSTELYDPVSKTWKQTIGSLNTGRGSRHTVTLLNNGKVLVVGGHGASGSFGITLDSAELYDPASQTWSYTATTLNTPRENHTATLLADGKVLVAGGSGSDTSRSTSELYDPDANTWTLTVGSLNTGRDSHTATLLADGQVLVAGGYNNSLNECLTSSELYNPSTDSWTPTTGSLHTKFVIHTATRLGNGQVLIAGGGTREVPLTANAELYDPASKTWSETGFLNSARNRHTMTLLANGKVLAAGGPDASQPTCELYDPASGTWTYTASFNIGRATHTATLLTNGLVLAAGGFTGTGTAIKSAELFSATPPLTGAMSLLLLAD